MEDGAQRALVFKKYYMLLPKWMLLLQISQSHVRDDRHPSSTSLSSCSTGRSCASKESSFTLRISHFLRLKTLVASGILQSTSCTLPSGPSCRCSKWFKTILSGYSFLLLEKSTQLEGIQVKNHQGDDAKRTFCF